MKNTLIKVCWKSSNVCVPPVLGPRTFYGARCLLMMSNAVVGAAKLSSNL